MGFWVFIAANLAGVLGYVRVKKYLSNFEHFGMWIVSLLFVHDWLAILRNNLSQIVTAESNVLQWMISLNTIILFW